MYIYVSSSVNYLINYIIKCTNQIMYYMFIYFELIINYTIKGAQAYTMGSNKLVRYFFKPITLKQNEYYKLYSTLSNKISYYKNNNALKRLTRVLGNNGNERLSTL